jgi:MinD superfamily P-loop ATPase
MQEVAEICGLTYSAEEQTVAAIICSGGKLAEEKYNYVGNEGCLNQKVILGGKKICPNGCLGGASCNLVCHVDAIKMVDGVAVIDKAACTSCGVCIGQCPQNCIERIPATAPVFIACSADCDSRATASFCKTGCIKCGLCLRSCKKGAIIMEKGKLPRIDYSKCNGCKACIAKCPRHIIKEH